MSNNVNNSYVYMWIAVFSKDGGFTAEQATTPHTLDTLSQALAQLEMQANANDWYSKLERLGTNRLSFIPIVLPDCHKVVVVWLDNNRNIRPMDNDHNDEIRMWLDGYATAKATTTAALLIESKPQMVYVKYDAKGKEIKRKPVSPKQTMKVIQATNHISLDNLKSYINAHETHSHNGITTFLACDLKEGIEGQIDYLSEGMALCRIDIDSTDIMIWKVHQKGDPDIIIRNAID